MLSLTKDELQHLCTSSDHPMLINVPVASSAHQDVMPIPLWFHRTSDAVGIFGNAHVDNATEWLPIFSQVEHNENMMPAAEDREWADDSALFQCKGLATRMHYKFLWSYVGNVKNPQRKIIR
jgi:hypothetical protein